MYDLIIIGGGPAALSCALVLGSAEKKEYMQDKKIAIIANQKASDMNAALLNNLYGVEQGVKGKDFLKESLKQLDMFSNIEQLSPDMVNAVLDKGDAYEVKTEKDTYKAKQVVLAIGHGKKVNDIEGLSQYVEKHINTPAGMERFALKNKNLLVDGKGMYVAGVLGGCASQVVIAAGTGADVAVQLLTKWNNGVFDHHHDK